MSSTNNGKPEVSPSPKATSLDDNSDYSSSDDEDSPFAWNSSARKTLDTNASAGVTKKTVWMYHCKPQQGRGITDPKEGIETVIVSFNGACDKALADVCFTPVLERTDKQKKFINKVGLLPHVVKVLQPDQAAFNNTDPTYFKKSNNYDVKGYVLLLPEKVRPAGRDTIKGWFYNTLIKNMKKYGVLDFEDGEEPDLNEQEADNDLDDWYYEIPALGSRLFHVNITGLCVNGLSKAFGCTNMQALLHNKNRLYSLWEPGQIPVRIIRVNKLKAKDLEPEDWQHYQDANKQPAVVKVEKDDGATTSKTPAEATATTTDAAATSTNAAASTNATTAPTTSKVSTPDKRNTTANFMTPDAKRPKNNEVPPGKPQKEKKKAAGKS